MSCTEWTKFLFSRILVQTNLLFIQLCSLDSINNGGRIGNCYRFWRDWTRYINSFKIFHQNLTFSFLKSDSLSLFLPFCLIFRFILCVLVCSVFLDDLFEGADLECDTEQPGCQQNCVNRFAVVNHKKLWELEMFVIMFTTTLFTAFTYMNKKVEERYKKKKDGARKTFRFKEDGGVVKSGLTSMGYIVMLLVRLFCETWFLYLENQLSKHQSQKIGFWESFWLKENWICATNSPKPAAGRSLNELLQIYDEICEVWQKKTF